MRSLPVVAAILALAGCAQAASKAVPKAAPTREPARTEAAVTGPAVEITFAGRTPGKPPLVTLLFDVTLRNAESAPRWFVLPLSLPKDAGVEAESDAGVAGVEVFEASGNGRAVLGKFLGTAGFQVVLVAPKAEVKLQRVGISYWQASPRKDLASLPIEVVIAKELTVGGEPAAAWFGTVDPLSGARVSADASAAKRAGSRMTEDRGEVPVVISEDRRVSLEVGVP